MKINSVADGAGWTVVARRVRSRGLATLAAVALIASVGACGGDSSGSTATSGPATTAAPGATTTAPTSGGVPLEPFRIGYTDSQTGALGPGYVGTGSFGLQAYLRQLNEAGGVHGRQIEVEYLDDRTDRETAVTNFRRLADSDVIAIVGASVSSFSAGQAPLADEAGVTLIAGGVPDALMEPVQKWFFSTNLAHTGSGQIQLGYAVEAMAAQGIATPKIATFIVDTAAGREKQALLEAAIAALGWGYVANEFYEIGDTDLTPQVGTIGRANPDVVLGLIAATDMATAGSQMAQRGITALIINSYAGADEPIFEALNNEKFLAPRAFVWPTDPEAAQMREHAEDAGVANQMVSNYFTRGYVLGMLIAEALDRCGVDCDRDGFRDAFESINGFDTGGMSGPISFSATDHLGVSEARIFRWNSAAGKSEAISGWIFGPCCGRTS